MTLRDYFAGHALTGLESAPIEIAANIERAAKRRGIEVVDYLAGSAYEVADAMLKARQK
jgi:hypothetical protein